MNDDKELSDVQGLLRLEVCLPKSEGPVWFLIDWVKPSKPTVAEVMRILSRFNRMALSLQRQSQRVDQNVAPARNEPYAHLLGVRCRMVDRVIGVHYRKTHESVRAARTATTSENQAELEFQLLRSGTEA